MKRISIVVPVFHNAASLPDLLRRFQGIAERNPELFEFVLVDDGSRDNSFAVMQSLAAQDPRVKAIKLTRNFGSNAACSAGFSYAQGDAVVAISADLQDPPELIERMLERWRAGSRVVLAARSGRADPWLSKQFSRVFWRLFRRYAVPTMPEGGCDFCLIDRQVLESLKLTSEPNAGIGMVLWTGYEPAVIYYQRGSREERYGRSMWTWSKRVTYLIDSFVSFSHVPVRAASLLGIALGLLGLFYAGLVVYTKLTQDVEIEQGWTSLMSVVLVVSGAQLLMTGILGEYLVRTLDATRRRPPFLIEQVVDHHATTKSHSTPTAGLIEEESTSRAR